jgi:DNA-binding transcriptional ArsR family regulator
MEDNLVTYYKALSNPIRLAVFNHVVSHSGGSAPENKEITCVSEISLAIGAPQPTVSNHLKVLEQAGLIKSIKVGTKSYQYVTKQAARNLLESAEYYSKMANSNPY